jgi:hypothetical protein
MARIDVHDEKMKLVNESLRILSIQLMDESVSVYKEVKQFLD